MAESEKSITWIVAAVMLVIAGFGWGFLAGSYVGATDPKTVVDRVNEADHDDIRIRRRPSAVGVAVAAAYTFVVTALGQLPNLPTVMTWHLSNRIWMPGLIVLLEIAAIAGGYGLKTLEKQLSQPYKRRR